MTIPDRYRQLVLQPVQLRDVIAPATLCAVLMELGIIGQRIGANWPQRYYIGDKFLQYVSFMGCAPALDFAPADSRQPDWSSFSYVYLSAQYASPRCLIDTMMAKPVCPHCAKRHVLAKQDPAHEGDALRCPACQHVAPLAAWDWHEYGGCARQFVGIVNVYPKEAMPTDSLLQQMCAKTQIDWRYFYIHDVLLDDTN